MYNRNQFGGNFGGNNFGSNAAGFLGGLFGNSGQPFKNAMDEYERWANRGQQMQNPFWQAGVGAIPQFQEWLGGMKDPSGFINNLMGKYQESPWAQYMKDQAMRAGVNAGSGTGLAGSTPMAQFMEQQAGNISSADMQNWLQNVLGINTQYGAGQGLLMGQGQNAANALTNMFSHMGDQMGGMAYGKGAGENFDFWNMLMGGLGLAGMFL